MHIESMAGDSSSNETSLNHMLSPFTARRHLIVGTFLLSLTI